MNKFTKAVTIAVFGAVASAPFANATHFYVDVSVSDPFETNSGLSWTAAFGGPKHCNVR